MAAKRFTRFTQGKAGELARVVHRQATMHARVNPHLKLRTPKNLLELAQAMRAMAEEALRYYRAEAHSALEARDYERRANIDELEANLKAVGDDYRRVARDFGDELVRQTYSAAKAATLLDLSNKGLQVDQQPTERMGFGVSFTSVDRAAMAAIANDMFTDLAGQTAKMESRAVAILRTTAGAVLSRELMLGHTPMEAARQLEVTLSARGFKMSQAMTDLNAAMLSMPTGSVLTGRIPNSVFDAARALRDDGELNFVDKAGKRWDLREYCEMAARTKLSIAKNEAAIATMADADVNLYTTNFVGDDCHICTPLEDQVWWTGAGESHGYDRLSDFPPWHPNCLHYVIPYVVEAHQQQTTAEAA